MPQGWQRRGVIPFEEMDARLKAMGLTRQWLAEASGRRPDSIRAALAPAAPPSKRSALIQKALSDAIEKEERDRAAAEGARVDVPPGYAAIFWTPEEFDRADRASRVAGAESVAEFCRDVIQTAARRLLREPPELKVAEEPPPYRARKQSGE